MRTRGTGRRALTLGASLGVVGASLLVVAALTLGGDGRGGSSDGPVARVTVIPGSTATTGAPNRSADASPNGSSSRLEDRSSATTLAGGTVTPSGRGVTCPARTVTVATAGELTRALRRARPGDSIRLLDGRYRGTFVGATPGTPARPIWLCGGAGAVIDGGGVSSGYGFHLARASYWRVVGFTIRNAQKGLVADATTGSVIQGLTVEDIGDEGIHLRSGSSGNAVLNNVVRRTGQRRGKFGEGVYVGSAVSNWKPNRSTPDRSDGNLIQGNRISQTTSECIDIKEGTTGGSVIGNTFDGAGMTSADSWVDVKGNGWLIKGNVGRRSPGDGFQTHRILKGWGAHNTFRGNTADMTGSRGLAISIHDPDSTGNRVVCDNRTISGRQVSSTVGCTA